LSHTLTFHAFAGLDEEGANDFLTAFFTARPHYLHYGTPPFVTSTGVNQTQVSPLFAPPLLPVPLPFEVQLSIPKLDFAPATNPLPPQLVLNSGQFALTTTVELHMLCSRDQHGVDGSGGIPIGAKLDLWAVGHILNQGNAVGFAVDQVEIVDVKPDGLESMLECILLQVLRGIAAQVSIPIPALSAGFITPIVQQGPQIDPDELDIWGTV